MRRWLEWLFASLIAAGTYTSLMDNAGRAPGVLPLLK
jgi:hypothetical protein